MEPRKILITWGLGYLWSHTAIVFAQAGYEIVLIDNLSNTHEEEVMDSLSQILGKTPTFYEGDIRDEVFLESIFEQHHFDGVIHFAAKKSVGESCHDPFLYYDNNITGTTTLLKVMEKYEVKSILFSSSATVYDTEKNIPPFTETDRLNTSNPYGTTKLAMEYLLKDMSQYKGFSVLCLRYFNPIWAHHSGLIGENPKGIPTNLLPFLMKVANHEIEKVTIFGKDYQTPDGTCIRDYIHVEDVAKAHLISYEHLLEQQEQILIQEDIAEQKEGAAGYYNIFNIGTGNGKSVQEMITIVASITEQEVAFEYGERRSGDIAVSVANPSKAKQLLNWEAEHSIIEAVQDAWNYYTHKKH